MKKKNIAIIGTVAIGKSTVIKNITKEFENNSKLKCYEEKEKYVYLERQYKDMKKWSFMSQMDFLSLRLRTLYKANNNEDDGVLINIFDRLYIDDYLYAEFSFEQNYISKDEWSLYREYFFKANKITESEFGKIDKIYLLLLDNDKVTKRRNKRNRFTEKELNHFEIIGNKYHNPKFIKFLKEHSMELEVIENEDSNKTSTKIINYINNFM